MTTTATANANNQTPSIAAPAGLSWKTILRRLFEKMGEQYAHSPNML